MTTRPTLIATAITNWHYLGVLVACIVATLPLELVIGARVYRQPRRLALTLISVGVPFVAIDWFATGAGLWWFGERYTIGMELFGRLPIEELLFFAVVPICAVLTHAAVVALTEARAEGGRWWRHTPR